MTSTPINDNSAKQIASKKHDPAPLFGVGLRSEHYKDCLESQEDEDKHIDYVEVHAENFFMQGGAALEVLRQVRDQYPVSIHATTLGLGSICGVPEKQILKLKKLVDDIDPFLVSDHACFAWFADPRKDGTELLHAGDLLPIAFDEQTLMAICENIDKTQSILGRPILLENLSAYVQLPGQQIAENLSATSFRDTEAQFLVEVCRQTGSKLLVDLNNLLVNAYNDGVEDKLSYAKAWLAKVPRELIGEVHLAGCTVPVKPGDLMVDDHAQPVSSELWSLLGQVRESCSNVPVTIEWDNQLPSWRTLLDESLKARAILERN